MSREFLNSGQVAVSLLGALLSSLELAPPPPPPPLQFFSLLRAWVFDLRDLGGLVQGLGFGFGVLGGFGSRTGRRQAEGHGLSHCGSLAGSAKTFKDPKT